MKLKIPSSLSYKAGASTRPTAGIQTLKRLRGWMMRNAAPKKNDRGQESTTIIIGVPRLAARDFGTEIARLRRRTA